MDVHDKLSELAELVTEARAMPMSASCMLNRAEVLDLIDTIRDLLPDELGRAADLLADRDAVIADGRAEAERILAAARAEREKLISGTAVARDADSTAERTRRDAVSEAAAMRAEVDDYVDEKLANFEVVLEKTLATVTRGREKLQGRSRLEELAEGTGEDPPAGHSPGHA